LRKESYIKNGESLDIDSKLCTGCGACLEVCPHAVLALGPRAFCDDEGDDEGNETAEGPGGSELLVRVLERSACMECGACAKNCPFGAISVKAGVGCAQAIIIGKLRGTAPECGCGGGSGCCG
jgi:ferredoxin